MTAKHRPAPRRRKRQNDALEKRVRWLERHFKSDIHSIATSIARVEVDEALCEHLEDAHGVQELRRA